VLRVVQFALTGAPYAGEAFKALVARRIEQGRSILFETILERGLAEIDKLSEAQAAFLLQAIGSLNRFALASTIINCGCYTNPH
jgi:hypothetical protein